MNVPAPSAGRTLSASGTSESQFAQTAVSRSMTTSVPTVFGTVSIFRPSTQIEDGDDYAVAHGPDDIDTVGRPADEFLGLVADGDDIGISPTVVGERHHRWLAEQTAILIGPQDR